METGHGRRRPWKARGVAVAAVRWPGARPTSLQRAHVAFSTIPAHSHSLSHSQRTRTPRRRIPRRRRRTPPVLPRRPIPPGRSSSTSLTTHWSSPSTASTRGEPSGPFPLALCGRHHGRRPAELAAGRVVHRPSFLASVLDVLGRACVSVKMTWSISP